MDDTPKKRRRVAPVRKRAAPRLNLSTTRSTIIRDETSLSQSQESIETLTVTNPDGSSQSKTNTLRSTTTSQQSHVTEFHETVVVPCFTSLNRAHFSSIVQAMTCRIDMALAQSDFMTYIDYKQQPYTVAQAGPGFFLVSCSERVKLDYPCFRGLNSFELDSRFRRMNIDHRLQPVERPLAILTRDLPETTCAEVILFNTLRSVEIDQCFQNFFKRETKQTCPETPLTPELLIDMTICRYVARLKGLQLSDVDDEESRCLFPIRALTIVPVDPKELSDNKFGTRRTIVPKSSYLTTPLNEIPYLDEDSTIVQRREESQFVTAIHYDVSGLTDVEMYHYSSPDDLFDYIMSGPSSKKPLFKPLPSKGIVQSVNPMDVETIGLIQQYIQWCDYKRQKKQNQIMQRLNGAVCESSPEPFHQYQQSSLDQQHLRQNAESLRAILTDLEQQPIGEKRFQKCLAANPRYEAAFTKKSVNETC